jgi:uncharacterized protein YneF (UPF0154 family)
MVNKTLLTVGGASVLSLAVGSIGGYFIAYKRLEREFQDRSDREISAARRQMKLLHTMNGYKTPQDAVEALGLKATNDEELQVFTGAVKSLLTYQGHPTEDIVPEQISRNVFEGVEDMTTEEDAFLEEVASRDITQPYVISADEYAENEFGFEQETVTYYAGDKVLCDSRDRSIDDAPRTVGDQNLRKFGHLSGDPRVVYIRNHKFNLELEVVLDEGKYSVTVLGFDDSPVQGARRVPTENSSPRDRFTGANPGGRVQVGD